MALSRDGLVLMSDIQRLPGCSQAPSSCMVKLLLEEAGLWPTPAGHWFLDLTYGIGQFYNTRYFRNVRIAGYDIRRLEWRRRPDWFKQAPAWAALHDLERGTLPQPVWVVVVDPPWQGYWHRMLVGQRWFYRVSRGFGTTQQILEAAARLSKTLGVPLLVHYPNPWVPRGFTEIFSVFWKPSLPRAKKIYRTWWGVLAPRR